MPDEPEVHGLVALMELRASRTRARVGSHGEPIPLDEQNRGRWGRLLIGRGLAALGRAESLQASRGKPLGPYTLQAAIAGCHARARTPAETDWERIVALYDALAARVPSPIVELNRSVAVARAHGPAAGLALVEALTGEPLLARYHLLPAVRGDLLEKVGRTDEACAEFERAAAMTGNAPERHEISRAGAGLTQGQSGGGRPSPDPTDGKAAPAA